MDLLTRSLCSLVAGVAGERKKRERNKKCIDSKSQPCYNSSVVDNK
nr:MAG TPA: hypothetical protein [Caudoviricetes sp.]